MISIIKKGGYMILIFSEKYDRTTDKVIDWLIFQNKKYLRINVDEDVVSDIEISIPARKSSDDIFKISFTNGKSFALSDVTSCWYRRGGLPFLSSLIPEEKDLTNAYESDQIAKYIHRYLIKEFQYIQKYFYLLMDRKKVKIIGSFFNSSISKLYQLQVAKDVGLTIPETAILNSKELMGNIFGGKNVITKSIQDFDMAQDERLHRIYTLYVNELTAKDTEDLPNEFYYSLIQNKIEKKFEIRAFFLENMIYSMAIFSQNDPKTKLDFRRYNDSRPNRTVPYQLPKHIEVKIIQFMNALQLNTGSLDLIYSKSGDFVFLEVNPVGQFGMTSTPCNYALEEQISHFLI
ncbi:ATP-GRASP peptide maturase, grasp-with-spasm system [Porphyromonas macacae]|uniref:ATP-GRASP peptide maturase, grasp-with-spasm system n=2 Tax=Porphyromonas macacae TaxID=28115 RepID=A0A379E8B3_9PORP|nr:ATP-GRASP peptide maturase, grasp-with-spasm system [Porphyromonas macacae]